MPRSGALQRFPGGWHRAVAHHPWCDPGSGGGEHAGHWLEVERSCAFLAHHEQSRRAIVQAGGIAGGHRAALGPECGLQPRQCLQVVSRRGRSSVVTCLRRSLALGNRHRHNLLGELAAVDRGHGPVM